MGGRIGIDTAFAVLGGSLLENIQLDQIQLDQIQLDQIQLRGQEAELRHTVEHSLGGGSNGVVTLFSVRVSRATQQNRSPHIHICGNLALGPKGNHGSPWAPRATHIYI